MKNPSYFLLCCALSVPASQAFSQTVKSLKKPQHTIQVDGNLKDWGDTLSYHNEAKKVNYELADDKENLYFAMRIENRGQQAQAMRNGITISFSPEGKKKEAYSLTFPSPDQDENSLYVMPKMDNAVTEQQLKQEDMEERRKADLLKLRDIQVKGFKDVETENISTANTYGIKTVLSLDDKGALVYEAAIPLKMIQVDKSSNKPWMFDIKINSFSDVKGRDGLKPAADAGGMGGMRGGGGGMGGGGMRGGMGSPAGGSASSGKAIEVKEKYYLSNTAG